jgi:hypothetical protein
VGVVIEEKLNPVCVGIDVGQLHDPTAIAVAEAIQKETGKHRWIKRIPAHLDRQGQFHPAKDTDPMMKTEYFIRHITRLPLGMSYPKVAEHLADLLVSPIFARRKVFVLIDVTGVGRPVYDDLQEEARLHEEARRIVIKPITFTHGETYNGKTGLLGKAFLVSRLQSLLQSGRIHAPDTPEVKATVEELKVYEIKVDTNGKDTYGAITGKHDDLATALGLSCLEDPYGMQARKSERVY